jgi:hypothetical protein
VKRICALGAALVALGCGAAPAVAETGTGLSANQALTAATATTSSASSSNQATQSTGQQTSQYGTCSHSKSTGRTHAHHELTRRGSTLHGCRSPESLVGFGLVWGTLRTLNSTVKHTATQLCLVTSWSGTRSPRSCAAGANRANREEV